MFVAVTTFVDGERPPQPFLARHWSYLDGLIVEGCLLCSGPRTSGEGGIMVLIADTEEDARRILDQDPLVRESLVSYRLTEFRATRTADATLTELM